MEKQCKVHKRCGGCQLQSMSYEEQLQYKQNRLSYLLSPFGRVEGIIGMANPLHYRNKVQAAFYWDYKRRRVASGVYQSTSQKIVPVDGCMIEDKAASKVAMTVRDLATQLKIKPYDMRYQTGVLRHVLIRRAFATGEIMVVLVTRTPLLPSKKALVKALLRAHPEITTVVRTTNSTDTNLLLGKDFEILYGKGYIEDILCGCRFKISPASFYQVNPVQCEILYQTALSFAELTGKERVFDAYCGTGTIGILAAEKAKQVTGVEINRSAIADAVTNAKCNQIDNIAFECADAADYISYAVKQKVYFDVVFTDPPRAGSDLKFLNAVCKMKPKKIIYISCNPSTLARDLKYLTAGGYQAERLQGVDMFPFTKHIETVVRLTLK